MMSNVRITVATSTAEMDALAPLWNELLAQQDHTIFQHFTWNRLAAATFRDRLTPHIVCADSSSGAAIIPAAIHHQTRDLELLGETLFDYRDVLHAGDSEVLQLAWQKLADTGSGLKVQAISSISAGERWTGFPLLSFANAPRVERTVTNEARFRLAHSRLGRQLRRMQRLGVIFRSYTGGDSAVVRYLYDCQRRAFAASSGNLFADPLRREFMVAAAAQAGNACQVHTLEDSDGLLVAGLLSFLDGDIRRCYTIHFQPEWAQYSPGVALLYEVTARSLAAGLTCDYMTGEYAYKLRLANATRPLYRVEMNSTDLAAIATRRIDTAA